MFNIGGGMPIEIAKDHFVTPNASLQYTLVENETYSEFGAGSLNLRVDQDENHVALGIFGFRYHTHADFAGRLKDKGTLIPELRGAITYDFAADDGIATNVFNGGGATFQVAGADIAEFGYRIGAGVSYHPIDGQGLSLTANYDSWLKEDFVGHSINAAIRYEF